MKSFDDSSPTRTQLDLIMEYFRNNPRRDIKQVEIVDWVVAEYTKRTGKVFGDPDRGIRTLVQDGKLTRVSNGVYRYDPDSVTKQELKGFTSAQKKAAMHAHSRVVTPQKKGIIKEKGWFVAGVVFLLIGIGCLALLHSAVSGEPPSVEDVEGFILLPILGVIFLIAGVAGIGIGITGDV